MKKFYFVLLTFLFFSTYQLYSFAKNVETPTNEEVELWSKTGLTFKQLIWSELFTDETCFYDGETIRTCIEAINFLGQFSEPQLKVSIQQNLPLKESFRLETPQHPKELPEMNRKSSLYFNKINFLKDTLDFSNLLLNPLDLYSFKVNNPKIKPTIPGQKLKSPDIFESLALSIISKIPKKDQEPYIAGNTFNLYFSLSSDPHSRFIPAAEWNNLETKTTQGETFAGIGVVFQKRNSNVFVNNVIDKSPASKAGIQRGDILTQANGKSIQNMNFEDIVTELTGPVGTMVDLQLVRKEEAINLQIKRDIVKIENVQSSLLNTMDSKFGLITIESFMDDQLAEKVSFHISKLTESGANGLIIDLRNNGGGFLNPAVDIGALFLGKVPITTLVDFKTKHRQHLVSSDFDKITKLPLVVLINHESASDSEVFSGAIKDYGRGWIVGIRSFGKGSAQLLSEYDSNTELILKETTSLFYHPSGNTNQLVGISPDFEVWSDPNGTEKDYPEILREEDLFVNPLDASPIPSIISEDFLNTKNKIRNKLHSKISDCILDKTRALNSYNESNAANDYQLLYAEEVLFCHKINIRL